MKILKNNRKKHENKYYSGQIFHYFCWDLSCLQYCNVVFALLHFFWISEMVSLSNSLHIWVSKDATADNEMNKTTWNMSKKKGK